MRARFIVSIILGVASTACHPQAETISAPDAGVATDGGTDAGRIDAGFDAGHGLIMVINCTGTTGTDFPKFNAGCSSAAQCSVGFHETDCCGNYFAIGLDTTSVPAFNDDEMTCENMYPGCGCAGGAITCDDGNVTTSRQNVGVTCDAGACWTFVNP